MTRYVALALLGLVLEANEAPAQTAWAENLFAGPTSHDFGVVPRGAQLFHPFKIKNIYAVPLTITDVRLSCGCVTATPTVQVIGPRQEAQLEVLMDARRFTGAKSVSIFVTVGPEYVSTATLQVSAFSRADVVFNPGEVDFGVVPRGHSPKQSIDVEYAGVLDWRVTELVKHTAPLEATFSEVYRRPGQVGYRVEVTLKPDAPAGALKEELLLRTNDQASPLVPILVQATVQAPLTVVPSVVSFGTIKAGESGSRRVIVRGSRPFRVVGVDGAGDGIIADLPPLPAATQVVTIKCQALKPGELNRQLRLRTDLGQEGPVTVTLEGTVVP